MVFDPFVGWGEKDTKVTIIHILNNYGSLSAKKIYYRLKKEHGISVSYQATHKALKKLNDAKVLDYVNSEYRINPQWVKKMKSFIEELEKNPKTMSDIFSTLDNGKTVSFTVNTEAEMGYFVLEFMAHFSNAGGKRPIMMNLFFVWTILPLNEDQYKLLKRVIKKQGIYVVSQEGLTYDKIMKKHWEDAGGKVAIGIKDCVSNCDIIAAGDYVINIYWDQKRLESDFEHSRSIKKESDLNYDELYEIISMPTKIDFVIIKNGEVAEKIRNKSLSYFK